MKLVVDTSVILKWFVRAENGHEEALWYSFATEDLIVPDLAFAEATAALRRKVLEGEVGEEQQMHHDAGELTNDPERHAYYIASLIPYFDNGIKRLRAAS